MLALSAAVDDVPDVRQRDLVALLGALGHVDPLVRDRLSGLEPVPRQLLQRVRALLRDADTTRWEHELCRLAAAQPDVHLVSVLDIGYPPLLRGVPDRPAYLFHRGPLAATAAGPAVAVAGTRRPSPSGLSRAARITSGLARAGTTVVSGLAEGIDAAAHRAAIDAGGRTVAVLGHGILHPVFPATNRGLAEEIVCRGGALVSQFPPDRTPDPSTFPARNVTASGLALGTLVVEAGPRSGARQQARRCLEHGRQLFLCPTVAEEPWARRHLDAPGTWVVDDAAHLLALLDRRPLEPVPVQGAFG